MEAALGGCAQSVFNDNPKPLPCSTHTKIPYTRQAALAKRTVTHASNTASRRATRVRNAAIKIGSEISFRTSCSTLPALKKGDFGVVAVDRKCSHGRTKCAQCEIDAISPFYMAVFQEDLQPNKGPCLYTCTCVFETMHTRPVPW